MPKWFLPVVAILYLPFLIILYVLNVRDVITTRTSGPILIGTLAVCLALYLPSIVRWFVRADTWREIASNIRSLPQKIGRLPYWIQVLLGIAAVGGCYVLWLDLHNWFLSLVPIAATLCGIALISVALWFLPQFQAGRLPSSIEELERAKLENRTGALPPNS